ncbi:MAG: FAD-dependent oxidoreductase, partial [Armatimonadota bacterium]
MHDKHYDLVVIGAGAGGIATALAAARLGVHTLLLERDENIGGTAVQAGVNCWEMSVSGTGISREMHHRLAAIPRAVGIYSIGHHCCWPTPGYPVFPGGQAMIDPKLTYAHTLRRYGSNGMGRDEDFVRENWHGVLSEPAALCRVAMEMLQETGCCDIWTGADVVEVVAEGQSMRACLVHRGGETCRITADAWVDCTGDAVFCTQVGCEMMYGTEGQQSFGEPHAPPSSLPDTNGVTLIYRITRDRQTWLPMPDDIPATCWWRDSFPVASITQGPADGWIVNMLPTMEGKDYRARDATEAYRECLRRAWAHWRWTQQAWPDYREYEISWVAPRLGVREGARVRGEYILTEHDLLAGVSGQAHADIIAIADHAIDVHGSHGGGCIEVHEPYGIPLRCLVPAGWSNL